MGGKLHSLNQRGFLPLCGVSRSWERCANNGKGYMPVGRPSPHQNALRAHPLTDPRTVPDCDDLRVKSLGSLRSLFKSCTQTTQINLDWKRLGVVVTEYLTVTEHPI
uniref:Putative encoded protein n=1 Tax=Dunaliella salina TaxID=3046 RepID=A0A1C8XRI9_DUNSA|nr:putative encoded protein [Dunaliella salina]